MFKVYLDNCCYNRPYDDCSQLSVKKEADSVEYINELIQYGAISLTTSYILLYEVNKISDLYKKEQIYEMLKYTSRYIDINRKDIIEKMSIEIQKSGIKMYDAFHVACAVFSNCDYFITTDKRLLNYRTDKIEMVNPIKFVDVWRSSI
jgi:predicted nucleic acid-binding protein